MLIEIVNLELAWFTTISMVLLEHCLNTNCAQGSNPEDRINRKPEDQIIDHRTVKK